MTQLSHMHILYGCAWRRESIGDESSVEEWAKEQTRLCPVFARWLRFGPYLSNSEETLWLKICNRAYSQMMSRNERFERKADRLAETDGWGGVPACAEAKW